MAFQMGERLVVGGHVTGVTEQVTEGVPSAPPGEALLTTLLTAGLRLDQATAAVEAIAGLHDTGCASDVVDRFSAVIADLTVAGFCSALVKAGALGGLLLAARNHPGSLAAARSLCTLVAASLKAVPALTPEQTAVAADAVVTAYRLHACDVAIAVNACSVLARIARDVSVPLAPASAASVIASVRSGIADAGLAIAGCAMFEALLCLPLNLPTLRAAGAGALLLEALEAHKGCSSVSLRCLRALGKLFEAGLCAPELGSTAARLIAHALHTAGDDAAVLPAALHAMTQLVVALPTTASELLPAGVAPVLATIIVHAKHPKTVVSGAVSAIAAISATRSTAVADQLVDARCATAVGTLLLTTTDLQIARDGCRAIANLWEFATPRQQLQADEAAREIVKAMSAFQDDEAVALYGCRAISNLALFSLRTDKLLDIGAAAVAVASLQRFGVTSGVCFPACLALRWLAELCTERQPLFAAGAPDAMSDVILATAAAQPPAPDQDLSDPATAAGQASTALSRLFGKELPDEDDDDEVLAAQTTAKVVRAMLCVMRSTRLPAAARQFADAVSSITAAPQGIDHLVELKAADALAETLHRLGAHFGDLNDAVRDALSDIIVHPGALPMNAVSVGAALVDIIAADCASPECFELALQALSELGLRIGRAKDTSGAELALLCTYGAGKVVVEAMVERRLDEDVIKDCCKLLSQFAVLPESCLQLLQCGAVDHLLRLIGIYCGSSEHAEIVVHACTALERLTSSARAEDAGKGALADGSALLALIDCISENQADARVASSGLAALGDVLALAPRQLPADCGFDAAATADLVNTVSKAHPASDAVISNATFALSVLQCRLGTPGLVHSFLADLPAVDSESIFRAQLTWATYHGSDAAAVAAVRAAGSEGEWQHEATHLAQLACYGRMDAMSTLLTMTRRRWTGASSKLAGAALRLSAARGDSFAVNCLLLDWQADPSALDGAALSLAAENGHLQVVETLLEHPDVTPACGHGAPIWAAARGGQLAVLDRLLADPRADPSSFHNAALRMACREGHVAVVQRLLADERVDPGAANHSAVYDAAASGHLAVLETLLLDPRVDAVDFLRTHHSDRDRIRCPDSSLYKLVRVPSVVRGLVLQSAESKFTDGFNGTHTRVHFPRSARPFTYADVLGWQATAWRRRRQAVLAWWMAR